MTLANLEILIQENVRLESRVGWENLKRKEFQISFVLLLKEDARHIHEVIQELRVTLTW